MKTQKDYEQKTVELIEKLNNMSVEKMHEFFKEQLVDINYIITARCNYLATRILIRLENSMYGVWVDTNDCNVILEYDDITTYELEPATANRIDEIFRKEYKVAR